MNIKSTLMRRDGISEHEAEDLIRAAREELNARLRSGDDDNAYNICEEYFGLEPDFLPELLSPYFV